MPQSPLSPLGLANLKSEGAPLHPDDLTWGGECNTAYELWYTKQLNAYTDFHGLPRATPYFRID